VNKVDVFSVHVWIWKPVEVILRRGEGEGTMEGMTIIRVHCLHAWKCHNETPWQLLYTHEKIKNLRVQISVSSIHNYIPNYKALLRWLPHLLFTLSSKLFRSGFQGPQPLPETVERLRNGAETHSLPFLC
jgi:hypothetical protein